ncbi:MAG: hypothetical protein PHV02_17385 [Rhodocyclaceae bacterium]|nr:hypothetical protein [Rhodocyclaceae bacterium]
MKDRDIDIARQKIRKACAERGLRINPYGAGWWIEGAGVSIVVSDLGYLNVRELEPAWGTIER